MKLSDILKKRNSVYDETELEYDDETDSVKPEESGSLDRAHEGGGALRMKFLRPVGFDEVTVVADCLKSGQAVVLNLENVENTVAKRMMDYLAGALYALDGKLERLARRAFLLAPYGVNISSEDMAQLHPEK